jgi:hypothetical protein
MTDDIHEQLIQKFKESDYIADQFDKSTDVLNFAVFMFHDIYIGWIHHENHAF